MNDGHEDSGDRGIEPEDDQLPQDLVKIDRAFERREEGAQDQGHNHEKSDAGEEI